MGKIINKAIRTNAKKSVTIKNATLSGVKGKGNGFVTFGTPVLNVSNVKIEPTTPGEGEKAMYNVFEGSQTPATVKQSVVSVSNVECTNPALAHNVVNVYTPADDAKIVIKDCNFVLNVANSNILRMANYGNAKNVTITFENCKWTYETVNATDADFEWAGLMIYQPAQTDIALNNDTSAIETWKIVIKNCEYNGEKVTSNNYGEHNQCVYLYNIGNDKQMVDPEGVIPMVFE